MLVKNVMSTNVATVSQEDTVEIAARLLNRRNVGVLPVTGSDGRLRGILTDRDIVLRCVAAGFDPALTRVRQIMTANPITVSPEDDAADATDLMARRQVRRLPVTVHGRVVGLLSLGDLATTQDYTTEAAACLSDICESIRRM